MDKEQRAIEERDTGEQFLAEREENDGGRRQEGRPETTKPL
jgi:hypothetical protein